MDTYLRGVDTKVSIFYQPKQLILNLNFDIDNFCL